MNNENLKHVKKGQVLNPKGRPKGSRSRKTIVREMLESKDPIDGMTTAEKIVKALIKKALKGDVSAFNALMDSGYGKVKDEIETTHKLVTMENVLIGYDEEGKEHQIDLGVGKVIEGEVVDE